MFGDALLESVTRRTIRQYLDTHPHPVGANRHIQFLKAAWSWILDRKDIPDNPCVGVTLNEEKPRTRYVEDLEYDIVYEIALRRRADYLPIFMEFAVLSRARRHEIAGYERSDLLEKGLRLIRGKGSRGEITEYSDRLTSAIKAAQALNPDVISPWLIHDRRGGQVKKMHLIALGADLWTQR